MANVLVAGRQARWESRGGVEGHERRIAQRLSIRVETVEPMRPASHDDHFVEPGFKRLEESRGWVEFREVVHRKSRREQGAEGALANHVRLLPAARGIEKCVKPDLEDIAYWRTVNLGCRAKDGFRVGWYPEVHVRGPPEPSSAARPKRRNKPGSIWASSRSKGRTTRWFGRWRQPRRAGRFIANGGWSRSTARRSTSPIRPPTARRSAIRQRPAERARFPKPRFVSLLENGTHVLFASRVGPCASGEITLAKLKTPEPLRQEFYGLRMAHFAIRSLLYEAGGPGGRRRSRSIIVPARGASGATQAGPSGRDPLLGTNAGFMRRSSPSCSTNVCVRAAACGVRAESSVR